MTLQELQQRIQLKDLTDGLLVFKNSENSFIANQYIKEIAVIRGLEIQYIDDLSDVVTDSFSILGNEEEKPTELRVFYTEDLDDTSVKNTKNLIIVTNKISSDSVEECLSTKIVSVPKLQPWQIKDFVYSMCEGADTSDLELMLGLYGNNIYRLTQEVDKINLFTESERKYLLKDMIRDGAFSDASSSTIFSITNAIQNKDIQTLSKLSTEMSKIDMNPFGMLSILLKNFKNIIMVKLLKNPTPESTGMDSKQIYAIQKSTVNYSQKQLIQIFRLLSDIDSQVKSGTLPTDMVVDYIILKILTM